MEREDPYLAKSWSCLLRLLSSPATGPWRSASRTCRDSCSTYSSLRPRPVRLQSPARTPPTAARRRASAASLRGLGVGVRAAGCVFAA